MPIYDYRCQDCGHDFTVIESLDEHEVVQHACPDCGSARVKRVIGPVHVQTGKKY